MGDDDNGDAKPFVDVLEQGEDAFGCGRVQGAGCFIAQDDLGIVGQGPGDGNTLFLSPGKL